MSDKTIRRDVLGKLLLGGAEGASFAGYEERIVDDVNICTTVLKSELNRKRSWITPNV